MRTQFPLFSSHLDFAHALWEKLVVPGDTVIDATCGNGHDTLKLSQLVLREGIGLVYAIDIQEKAISRTKTLLESEFDSMKLEHVKFIHECHSKAFRVIPEGSVKLIVFNLGYLPQGDKTLTTQTEVTIESLKAAKALLVEGGVICLTCYPGHSEGEREELAIVAYTKQLDPKQWSCTHTCWTNRKKSPSLVLIQRCL